LKTIGVLIIPFHISMIVRLFVRPVLRKPQMWLYCFPAPVPTSLSVLIRLRGYLILSVLIGRQVHQLADRIICRAPTLFPEIFGGADGSCTRVHNGMERGFCAYTLPQLVFILSHPRETDAQKGRKFLFRGH